MNKKIYEGIYSKIPAKKVDSFLVSDEQKKAEDKLIPFYLWETLAHNFMMVKQGILPQDVGEKILKTLILYIEKNEKEKLSVDQNIGDVHENFEFMLKHDIGDQAGWFHMARSRNDQVACDQKLITKKLLFDLFYELSEFAKILGKKADEYKSVLMPGISHLRIAMPSSFGFWLQSYLDQIIECERILQEVYLVTDKSPLGAGAGYGVNWDIDPEITREFLGFNNKFNNALCAIDSRGVHELYLLGPLSVLLLILSRMMEDIIIFSMPEIDWILLSEEFTTGSSIMPQKMNPDVAEKTRGKAGKILGEFVSISTSLKGTPSGYNRDLADSKIAIIDSMMEAISVLSIVKEMASKIVPNEETMSKAVFQSLSTKVSDVLVKKYNIPFRQAHLIVGKALALSNKNILEITEKVLEKCIFSVAGQKIKLDKNFIKNILLLDNILDEFTYEGSINPQFVSKANVKLLDDNNKFILFLKNEQDKFNKAKKDLIEKVKEFLK